MSLLDIAEALFEPQNMWNRHTVLTQSQPQLFRGPHLDLYPVKDGVELQADLPGMVKEAIIISVEKDMLTISGERNNTIDLEDEKYHYSERRFGKFSRSVKLPFHADPTTVSAKFENGVLTVHLPQPESTKVGVIPIQ